MTSPSRRSSRTGLFSRSRKRRRRARLVLLASLVLLLVAAAVALAVMAIPLLRVQDRATEARSELVAARNALEQDRPKVARQHLARAREAVDEAHVDLGSTGARVWQRLPVAGPAVEDVRHLVAALDHTTAMADAGLKVYPAITGRNGRLFDGERVDLDLLGTLIRKGRVMGREAVNAQEELAAVRADAPVVGTRLATSRDEARKVIDPVADGYRTVEPMLDVLPRMLGSEGRTRYLIAIMNPAELHWSGGGTLTATVMEATRGRTRMGEQIKLGDSDKVRWANWEGVPGNPFHFTGIHRVSDATFHPDWSVSGPEIQRAWGAATGTPIDAVVAIDLPALATLLEVTGPIRSEGYGTVTGSNLVELLAGSYDRMEDQAARHRLNADLAGVFRERLLSAGRLRPKVEALGEAARGRHLALWSTDPQVQEVYEDLDVSGTLGSAAHDYLGFFTQNVNGAKTDYWLKRSLDSRVTLRADGSARVRLTVDLHNDSPPYAHGGEDPGTGYWTRYNTVDVLQMLPEGATLEKLVTPGNDIINTREWDDRPFYRRRVPMEPGEKVAVTAVYDVPAAATVTGEGLAYRLAYDPQGMVNPQSLRVHLVYPDGWSAAELPEGWKAVGDGAVLDAGALDSTGVWRVDLTR